MAKDNEEVQLGDVADLISELVALQVIALRQDFEHRSGLILALSNAGFDNSRIASLVGTSTATVRSAVNKAKKSKEQKS